MDLSKTIAMAQLKLYFGAAELSKNPYTALKLKAMGLVFHDRLIDKRPTYREFLS